MNRRLFAGLVLASLTLAGSGSAVGAAAKLPPTWDGLVVVKSKKLAAVYLAPGADFRVYTKVMLDPTEAAFRKNFKSDFNDQSMGLNDRLTGADMQAMLAEARTGAGEIFSKALTAGGYTVVTTPGKDVLRLRTALINIDVAAPDLHTFSQSAQFTGAAGYATLVVEARDSLTGAILGRAVDQRLAGDNTGGIRNRVTNLADFSDLVKTWATITVKGLDTLKTLSPVDASGKSKGTA